MSAPENAGNDRGRSAKVWRGVGKSGGTKLVVQAVTALLGILTTRLIIENFGLDTYAQYGLLVGIGALIPFADLGISAAVMNAIAASQSPANESRTRLVLLTALRVLIGSAVVILLISGILYLTGLWPVILGEALSPSTGPLAASAVLGVVAITLPLGIGQRILSGLGKHHLTIALGGLQSPLTLGGIFLVVVAGLAAGPGLAVIPYVVAFVIAVVACLIARRLLSPTFGWAVSNVARLRTVRGTKVFDVAWPSMLMMMALPIAMQTDRIVLSHVTGPQDLAEYNLAWQMYIPIWGLVSAAGFTLWPVFASERERGKSVSPIPMAGAFAGIAVCLSLAVSLLSGLLAELASGGQLTLGIGVVVSFSFLMVFQAAKYPLGMFMTDARGLRYQACMVVLMVPVNFGLSWYLAGIWGAAGPVVGSAVGVLIFQVLANLFWVRRELARRQQAQLDS